MHSLELGTNIQSLSKKPCWEQIFSAWVQKFSLSLIWLKQKELLEVDAAVYAEDFMEVYTLEQVVSF